MSYLKSKSFQDALKKAVGVASDPGKISNLLGSVTDKMSDMDESKKRVGEFFERVRILMRMLLAYINGTYREIPWKSLVMIVGSLIYFLMPLDVIPDFIPLGGFADDISLIFLVFATVNEDIEAFLDYERNQRKPATDDNLFE